MPVCATVDVERVRHATRALAESLGFDTVDTERVVLAASELATNLARYAQQGQILIRAVQKAGWVGVEIESRDAGPGIDNPAQATRGGTSTGGGLGAGLAGAQRLMDEFTLSSAPTGTTVVCRKWRKTP